MSKLGWFGASFGHAAMVLSFYYVSSRAGVVALCAVRCVCIANATQAGPIWCIFWEFVENPLARFT